MKKFLGTLAIWIVLTFVFAFFFAGYLLDPQHIERAILFIAFLLTVATHLYTEQWDKIEELEKRIQQLEGAHGGSPADPPVEGA